MDYRMSKEQKIITKEDLLPLDAYTKVRRQMRKELVEFKKNRRILLGPYATFYFECYETMTIMLFQLSCQCFLQYNEIRILEAIVQ